MVGIITGTIFFLLIFEYLCALPQMVISWRILSKNKEDGYRNKLNKKQYIKICVILGVLSGLLNKVVDHVDSSLILLLLIALYCFLVHIKMRIFFYWILHLNYAKKTVKQLLLVFLLMPFKGLMMIYFVFAKRKNKVPDEYLEPPSDSVNYGDYN